MGAPVTRRHFLTAALGGAVIVATDSVTAASAFASVDFRRSTRVLDPAAASSCISTYGADNVVASARHSAALRALHAGWYRVPIQWNGGHPISSAVGGPTDVPALAWIEAILEVGGTPCVVIGGGPQTGRGPRADMNFTAADAASLVRFLGARVRHYVIGNEPGNAGFSIDEYCTFFLHVVGAMKTADSTITVAGPAWSYFDQAVLATFIERCGAATDIVDFHHYGQGAQTLGDAVSLQQTRQWFTEVSWVRAQLERVGAGDTQVQVGECHYSYDVQDGRLYEAITTVWAASVLGQTLSAGGRLFQYSDLNGPLGLTADVGDARHLPVGTRLPIYHGWGVWTGAGAEFPGLGRSLYSAYSSDADLEVYALDGPKILLVNKSLSAKNVTLRLPGSSPGTYSSWVTQRRLPFAPPTRASRSAPYNDRIVVPMSGYQVAVVVLRPFRAPVPAIHPQQALVAADDPAS